MIRVSVPHSRLTDVVWYDDTESKMYIHFLHTDTVWVYYGVSRNVFESMLTAPSIGNYFNHHVRNNYNCARVELEHERNY